MTYWTVGDKLLGEIDDCSRNLAGPIPSSVIKGL